MTRFDQRRVALTPAWLAVSVAALVALHVAHAAPQRLGPLGTLVDDRFDGTQTTYNWIPVLGNWTQTSGTYNSHTALLQLSRVDLFS